MRKVTEGFGIISGDGDSMCIDPNAPEPKDTLSKRHFQWEEMRIYPLEFFPEEVASGGRLKGKPVRYKIIVEIEEMEK